MKAMPGFVDRTLDNGLRVVVWPDAVAPAACVEVRYNVGSRCDPPGSRGFAHLFEHLMFEGSANVAPGEHMRLVQSWGGAVRGTTSTEWTRYAQTVPVQKLDHAFFLEADRMATLLQAVSQEALDKQRAIVAAEWRERVAGDPARSARERLRELCFPPGHPYHHGTLGSMEDLAAASLDDVRGFFSTYYAPENAIVVVVGDVDADRVLASVEAHFAAVPARPRTFVPPAVVTEPPSSPPGRATLKSGIRARVLCLGFWLPPEGTDLLRAALAVRMLSAGPLARFSRNLAERADVFEGGVPTARIVRHFEAPSLGCILARLRPGCSFEDAKTVLVGQLRELVENAPTARELQRVKNMWSRERLATLSGLEGRASQLAELAMFGGEPYRSDDEFERLAAVSVDEVCKAAADYLADREPSVLEFEPPPVGATA